ncbi:MAG: hypothetical protein ACHQ9S_23055, partial [Candidatus Binatia bacterium]
TSIKKEATQFGYLPAGCAGTTLPVSAACTGVRAIVFSIASPNRLIADGATLYTCNIKIAAGAADGLYPLTVSNVSLSYPSPPGGAVPGATGVNGSVQVGPPPLESPTPTNTVVLPSATPTTPVVLPSATPSHAAPTATATATAKATATNTSAPVTLATPIGATDTALTVSNASSLPASGTVQIDSEQITYTGKSGNQLTGLTRGANNTTAAAHSTGAVVTVVTPPAPSGEDSDGCQISAVGSRASWLLLIPAVGLLVARRRHR